MSLGVEVRRVYDDPTGKTAEYRVLVDRLWPRGMSKAALHLDGWAKDAAPSSELRRWYGHDPDRFEEFARLYRAELRKQPASGAVAAIAEAAASRSRVVLLTATKDMGRSGAEVLARHLRAILPKRR